jgi:predicted nucleotide-binding protein
MSQLEFSVHAAKVDAASLLRITEALRPLAVEAAQITLTSFRNLEDTESNRGVIKEQERAISVGGEAAAKITKVRLRNGVVHHDLGWDPVSLEAIDDCESAELIVGSYHGGYWGYFNLRISDEGCEVSIDATPHFVERVGDAVRDVLAATVDASQLAAPGPTLKIFIAHGADPQWKYINAMLTKADGFEVEAFESSDRSGRHTLRVVDQMIRSSDVALVVMTGEDQMPDGSLRARENVVHELGYCQGALGIDQTIILLEDGVSEPSNIAGLTQIRFRKNAVIDAEDKILLALNLRKQRLSGMM